MQSVNFFLENLENHLWQEEMFFLPNEGDFISEGVFNEQRKWEVVGRIYFSANQEWGIFLKEIE